MKKIVKIICLITLLTACNKNTKIDINYKEDLKNQISSNYTYKFIGESEHFYFETGKVYYNGKERELLISNFNFKEKMNQDTTYLVNLYFNNELLYGDEYNKVDLSEEQYRNLAIAEYGLVGEKDKDGDIIGESDSFLETTKDNFRDSIKIDIQYYLKDKCNKEQLKIKIVEEK